MEIEKEASQFLVHLLSKFSGEGLTDDEECASFRLLCTLPDSACIGDFMKAASPDVVASIGLPSAVAVSLAPLLARLERNLPYAGRFASLFESVPA